VESNLGLIRLYYCFLKEHEKDNLTASAVLEKYQTSISRQLDFSSFCF